MNNLFIFLILFLLSIESMHAQVKGQFYYELNVNQEYRDNIPTYSDSSKINDFRFRNSFLIGYYGNLKSLSGSWGASYENRYQQYFKFTDYTRIEHLFNLKTSFPFLRSNTIYFDEAFKIRSYSNLKPNNYLRNIFSVYLKSMVNTKLDLFFGYKNWIKNYPYSFNSINYTSYRPFMKINYQLGRNSFVGFKTEFQWHNGFLYPTQTNPNSVGNFSGSRYLIEVFGNTILLNKFLIDFTYKFEYDVPNEINNQSTGENQGDEEPEDLLIEDPDYDYVKNQTAASLLYRISAKLSLFSFLVLQNKDFINWQINTEGNTLRSDLFFYSSIILKYKIYPDFRVSLNYIYENRNSNLKTMNYFRNTVSVGLQYNF